MSPRRGRHARPSRHITAVLILTALAVLMVASTVAVSCTARKRPPASAADTIPASDERPSADEDSAQFSWPADITWETVAGIDLPVSASAGPRVRTAGRASGFGHSPAGAVLAALHLIVRTSYQVGAAVWEPTLRDQVVGPDAAAYAHEVRRAAEQNPGAARIYASIGGVRLDAFGEEAASMRVLIEAPTPGGGDARAAATVQVSRSGSDWQLIAPPRGDWSTVRVDVPSDTAASYTPLPAR